MRVYALSDVHVDQASNLQWLKNLSGSDYKDDVLLLAGDVTHRLNLLDYTFCLLKQKFKHVFFVPGNHELWVTRREAGDSLQKFYEVIKLCRNAGVETQTRTFDLDSARLTIVPLYSWYVLPQEGTDSLYIPDEHESVHFSAWADNHLVRWPVDHSLSIADFFMSLNESLSAFQAQGDVISFSHFLPRRELMYASRRERAQYTGSSIRFNFSRVAGTKALDRMLRSIGATVHVYGHQHRNRTRTIDGVCYVSCCLGYESERNQNRVQIGPDVPKQVWSANLTSSASALTEKRQLIAGEP